MSQTVIKSTVQTRALHTDVVIQVTRAQLLKFFQFIVVIAMVVLNVLAITIASPFLKELFVSQFILVLIFFIKNLKSNPISK
jgi:quinol-cytochrome oxidoreductase complex cytochrome b subunit